VSAERKAWAEPGLSVETRAALACFEVLMRYNDEPETVIAEAIRAARCDAFDEAAAACEHLSLDCVAAIRRLKAGR
jgi:hypothetical protein